MNILMERHYPIFQMYQELRDQLMAILSDDDLSYRPADGNETLGALCRQIGEVEVSYINSFKEFKQDFSYRNEEPGLEGNVARLSVWYRELDGELRSTLQQLSDDDVDNRLIDRGGDFRLPPRIQLEIYKEALLIFYGKASVYLKAIEKPLPKQWQEWIG